MNSIYHPLPQGAELCPDEFIGMNDRPLSLSHSLTHREEQTMALSFTEGTARVVSTLGARVAETFKGNASLGRLYIVASGLDESVNKEVTDYIKTQTPNAKILTSDVHSTDDAAKMKSSVVNALGRSTFVKSKVVLPISAPDQEGNKVVYAYSVTITRK
jgi:hypothetical protein